MDNRVYGCGHCGLQFTGKHLECPQCEANYIIPAFNVFNSLGMNIGTVYGFDEKDALESANQTPIFDRYHAISVREKTR